MMSPARTAIGYVLAPDDKVAAVRIDKIDRRLNFARLSSIAAHLMKEKSNSAAYRWSVKEPWWVF